MTTSVKTIRQVGATLAIGLSLRFVLSRTGWEPPAFLGSRVFPSLVLWIIFGIYWGIAGRNSPPTENAESWISTYLHQFMLSAAFLVLILPLPGLTQWFLPQQFPFVIATGLIVQVASMLLAIWARKHLGRNWSAEVRIAVGHQLVSSGPYRLLRHPIYTAMLGMFLGTAVASSQFHALLGVALLIVAYLRKTRLEDQILARKFGAEYDSYRRDTWALVPLFF